ncbi:MAG: (d)CMP kinase [Eubacteriales bacterium]|nr:(d)CMP kinase [Eubacteriales bacterium]
MTKPLQIAIDGPAGAGKSTAAKAVARALDILYLDTGAMYRAAALYAFRQGVDPTCMEQVLPLLPAIAVTVRYENGAQRTILNGEDVTDLIRTQEISKGASDISVHRPMREKMAALQREIASSQPVVMDGREIGSYVLPSAPYKFFITAEPRERAKRRMLELQQKGQDGGTLEELEAAIIARDHTDSSREFAPLVQTPDAILIDTTHMDINAVIQTVLNHIQR